MWSFCQAAFAGAAVFKPPTLTKAQQTTAAGQNKTDQDI